MNARAPGIRRALAMSLACGLALCCAGASELPDSVQTQQAREKWVKAKGYKVYYTKKFDLADLPEYSPQQKVSGTLRMWGSNYFTDSPLAEYWEKDFQKYQPDVKFDFHLKTSEHAVSALIFGVSDIGPMGRQIMWDEQLAFQRQFGYLPLGIVAVTGSYDVSGWNPPIGVYLNSNNPLTRLSLRQLDGIFGAERSGAWRDLTWDKSLARGPERNIRTWGQLGLTGEWANKPIHPRGSDVTLSNWADLIERLAFKGGTKWNPALYEGPRADISWKAHGKTRDQQIIAGVESDPLAIAFTFQRVVNSTKADVRVLPLAVRPDGPFIAPSARTFFDGSYPMHNGAYLYLNRVPGQPLPARDREFVRFVLSREGQQIVADSRIFIPLSADQVQAELKKLD